MDFEAVKESFYNDDSLIFNGFQSMQIEEHQPFVEALWEFVFGFFIIDAPANIRNKIPILIVNRDRNPAFQDASLAQADVKIFNGLSAQTSLRQIGMVRIKFEFEFERMVHQARFWLRAFYRDLGRLVIRLVQDFPGNVQGLPEVNIFIFHYEGQNISAVISGKAMPEIFIQADMKGIWIVAVMNRARTA